MPIVWDDAARTTLPKKTRAEAPPFAPGDAKRLWAAIRKAHAVRGNKYDPVQAVFVQGRSLTTPELAALMEKCEALFALEEPPAVEDRDVCAAFLALASKLAYSQPLAFVLATLPLPRAFAAFVRSCDFGVVPRWTRMSDPFRLVVAPPETDAIDAS